MLKKKHEFRIIGLVTNLQKCSNSKFFEPSLITANDDNLQLTDHHNQQCILILPFQQPDLRKLNLSK